MHTIKEKRRSSGILQLLIKTIYSHDTYIQKISGHSPQKHYMHCFKQRVLWFLPLLFQKLVCKSDQLVKRRAKSGLITVNSSWQEVKDFVNKFIDKEFTVGGTTGILKTFIITPFIPHQQVWWNTNLLPKKIIWQGRLKPYFRVRKLTFAFILWGTKTSSCFATRVVSTSEMSKTKLWRWMSPWEQLHLLTTSRNTFWENCPMPKKSK